MWRVSDLLELVCFLTLLKTLRVSQSQDRFLCRRRMSENVTHVQ